MTEPHEQPRLGRLWAAVMLSAMLLLAAGAGYRVLSRQQQRFAPQQAVISPVLASLPLEFGSWRGRPAPLDRSVTAAIKAEPYLSRRYEDASTGEDVLLFVTAAASARSMLGHRPEICYPAIGWVLEDARLVELAMDGTPVKVRLQRFLSPGYGNRRQLVLSYFVVRGEATIDEACFRGMHWRRPKPAHDVSRHLSQVQVIAPVAPDVASAERVVIRFAGLSLAPLSSLSQ